MKLVVPALLLVAACAASPASPPPPPDAPSPPAPIDVDDCFAPDCPYVGALTVPVRDDDIAETMLPVALDGIDQFGYETYGATRSTTTASGAWAKLSDDGAYVRVRATAAGTGHFEVDAYTPYHDTEVVGHDQLTLDVLPVDHVTLDLPRYVALDPPIAPVILGSSFTIAVRLLSADNRRLVDISAAITGDAMQAYWNLAATDALPAGRHTVTVGANSLAQPATLTFDTIAHVAAIRISDTREPYPSYYHLVCAHAFVDNREVYSEWQMTATNANGWIPATAGNCLEVVPGNGDGDPNVATVTFVAADGTTAHLGVTE